MATLEAVSGHLSASYRALDMRWLASVEVWLDRKQVEFQQQYVQPLDVDVRLALAALEPMSKIVARAQRRYNLR